jgi:hypothetical protein
MLLGGDCQLNWLSSILSGAPGKAKFAKIVCKFIADAEPEFTTHYYSDQFAIHKLDKNGNVAATLYLGNAYGDYCRAPRGKRKDVLAAYFTQAAPLLDSLHDSMPYILAHIQPRIFLEATRLSGEIMVKKKVGTDGNSAPGQSDGVAFPSQPIGEHFVLLLVRDTPIQLMYLSDKIFGDWQTTLDELLPRAITNLARITPEPFQRVKHGVYYSHYRDNHDASRLLVKHRVEECRVKGRPLAFIANRDSLFITGEDDEEGIAVVLPMVAEVLTQPRSMPVFPLVYDGDNWRQYVVPAEHPHKTIIDNMVLTSLNEIYYNQKDLLDQKHQLECADVFTASFMLYQRNDSKAYFSCSTWSSGITTYLPECQFVGFVDWAGALKEGAAKGAKLQEEKQGEVVLTVPWSVVKAVMGEYMQLLDCYPPRYRVVDFPTVEQLAQMRELMPAE